MMTCPHCGKTAPHPASWRQRSIDGLSFCGWCEKKARSRDWLHGTWRRDESPSDDLPSED